VNVRPTLSPVRAVNFLAQAAAADRLHQIMIEELERDGYRWVAPGIWEKRNERGELIASMAL
jgi:hypothetical protein